MVDVEVRENAQEPGAQVRSGGELAPRTEGTLVRLLHQILGFLTGADKASCHAVDLIAQLERLLLKTNTSPRFLREPAGVIRRRNALAHPAKTLAKCSNAGSRRAIPGEL